MTRALAALLLLLTASCAAKNVCKPDLVVQGASHVLALQRELGQIRTGEMDLDVPPLVADRIVKLRNALGDETNAVMACVDPSNDASDVQQKLAQALHANMPVASANVPITKGNRSDDRVSGAYGGNLQVQVNRPAQVAGVLEVRYTFDIECGVDTLLEIYEVRDGVWVEKMRWQAPRLKEVSDAFGDFFETSFVLEPSGSTERAGKWLLAVAHGTPWCTSRFSELKIDLLAPGSNASTPRVVWHTERDYSRGDFGDTMKSSRDTFELRVNADGMSFDSERCFERRVIYRYSVDGNEHVRRVSPIALNAIGFVSEWIRAPWFEAKAFSLENGARSLESVHDAFNAPSKPDSKEYVSNSYGAVLQCKAPNTYQVEIGSTLDKIVPGKPGGESSPLPSRYFKVRATGDGYVMLSSPSQPDPSCSGRDLMPVSSP